MNKIMEKKQLSTAVYQYKLQHSQLAARAQAGQFVIVRIDDNGERVPLTIADFDRDAGTVTLIFQELGKSTLQLGHMEEGDTIRDLVGPLGKPSDIELFGHVVCVGGGIGAAPVYPIAKSLKEAGNTLTTIIGARNQDLIILEDEFRQFSDEVIITTDDGSYGMHGLVTDALRPLLESGSVDRVITIGPAIMMKFVCKLTEEFNTPTIVSLNPIMVDGTGMCGACRVEVGGETKFGCVDGPEFDGHEVDFSLLMARQRQYLDQERTALIEHEERCGACQSKKE